MGDQTVDPSIRKRSVVECAICGKNLKGRISYTIEFQYAFVYVCSLRHKDFVTRGLNEKQPLRKTGILWKDESKSKATQLQEQIVGVGQMQVI